jgi:hypothetical protein
LDNAWSAIHELIHELQCTHAGGARSAASGAHQCPGYRS